MQTLIREKVAAPMVASFFFTYATISGEKMGQLKFLSREKLMEYLDEELRLSLNERGLFEIDQYGWLDDGELDPEYCGHAMWQEKPPELKKLLILGEEFTSLMRSARHSLGLTCLYNDVTDSQMNDSAYYCSFYYADTINKLNLSSDRIREFLIIAFAHRPSCKESWPPPGKNIRTKKAFDTFRAPFQHILNEVTLRSDAPSLREKLTAILPLAEKIAQKRSDNQNPVRHLTHFRHRIATAANNMSMGYPDEALATDNSALNDAPTNQELIDWYRTLIEISNHVFMAEHLHRRLCQQLGAVSGHPHTTRKMM